MLRKDYMTWACGSHEISLARPQIMGVVNVTPDSFSDGGDHATPQAAIDYAFQLLDEGADIIDVGGESTRPGFTAVTPDEEARRVMPVVQALAKAGAIVSIDTRHAQVAKMAVKLGASIINDVTGFTDPEMIEVATQTGAGCIVMHAGEVSQPVRRRSVSLSTDAKARERAKAEKIAEEEGKVLVADNPTAAELDKQKSAEKLDEVMKKSARGYASTVRLAGTRRFTLPEEAPIMRQVMGFLSDRARELRRAGVSKERICIDPGPGFGKLAGEDVVIQRANQKLCTMGYPVMCAVSRKRLVGAVSGVTEAAARDAATIGIVLGAVQDGASILRVHNVAATRQALDAYLATTRSDERRAFIALGSNMGNPSLNIAKAVVAIDEIPLTCVVDTSNAYKTEPAYGLKSAVVDAVVEIKTELSPLVLLDNLLAIEKSMGRVRDNNAPHAANRTIDLDLLWMEGEYHAGNKLQLPHPRIGERDFVIIPMQDLVHDAERFFQHEGINVLASEYRYGRIIEDLGPIAWQD